MAPTPMRIRWRIICVRVVFFLGWGAHREDGLQYEIKADVSTKDCSL